ncbi:MAG TPA: HEAT repeat domain-containing protein [Phycisphaerae bacterium]|nr:HEAT repeat domain-containing protein [Phycisphaerae bacterium]
MKHRCGMALPVLVCGVLAVSGCDQFRFQEPKKPVIAPARAYIDAKAVLLQAAEDPDPATRSHAMEALASALGREAGAVFVQGLADKMPAVRFAAALAIGDVKYAPALPALQAMAQVNTGEPDKRVYCAVIYALHQLGDDTYAGELAPLLFDAEPEVRMDAAMAMGKMGEPSAVGPLNSAMTGEQDDGVKLQVTESLAMLGDARSAEILEVYTKGYYLDIRLAAIPALAQTGSARAARALEQLCHERHPARVRVSAAGQLARLGHVDPEGYRLCLRAIREPEKMLTENVDRRTADKDAASLKRLAAMSLGWMGQQEAVEHLHPMLRSSDGGHRVAAALSLVRLLKDYRLVAAPAAPATRPATTAPAAETPREMPKLHTAGGKD